MRNDYFLRAEPYRNKVIEKIRLLPEKERIKKIEEAGYNVLMLHSKDVYMDLFTDSGASAMSDNQWGGMMIGDEAYAGAESFYTLESAVQDIFGYKYVMPAHQGRAAQNLLYHVIVQENKYTLSNTYYGGDIVEGIGGITVNLASDAAYDLCSDQTFKGDIDLDLLRRAIRELGAENISSIVPVVTNNLAGGQPVSMQNLRSVREICNENGIPVYLDACRILENAFFIKESERGYKDKTLKSIVREMASYADGCLVSGKKDGLCSIGGFVATNVEEVYLAMLPMLISIEGFTTCGGMAGRDMEALAVGLYEACEDDYLTFRVEQVRRLASELSDLGVPIVKPYSGSSVYIDAKKFMQHLPFTNYRAESIAAAAYIEGGIRVSPFGQLMSGHSSSSDEHIDDRLDFLKRGVFANRENVSGKEVEAKYEFVRLAIPRRVYSQAHLEIVRDIIFEVYNNRLRISGLNIESQPRYYRFFSAKMKPVSDSFWVRDNF